MIICFDFNYSHDAKYIFLNTTKIAEHIFKLLKKIFDWIYPIILMCIESHCMLKNNHLYIMNVVFEFLGLGFLDLIYHCSINSKIHSFKNKMKLTKILAPKERNFVYALEEDGRVFLYIRHRIQQKCVRIRCRKKKCKRTLRLHPINNLRYIID